MKANARAARGWLFLAATVLLLTAALRLHNLGESSLWYDEGTSWRQATRNPSEIAANAARDIHPPGYYWLLAGARNLFGESEFALRWPSAMASVLAAACLLLSGWRLGGSPAAVLATILFMAQSFTQEYAQIARMYTWHTLWGNAALLMSLACVRHPTGWRITALALLNAAGLWTHYSFVFVLLAQGVMLLVFFQRRIRPIITIYALTLLFFLPWLPAALDSLIGWPNTGLGLGLAEALREIARSLIISHVGEYSPLFFSLVVIAISVGLLGWANAWRQLTLAERLIPLWSLLPLTLFLLQGLYRPANLKFLLPAQAAFILWLGLGYSRLWRRQRIGLLLSYTPLLLGLAVGTITHFQQGPTRADYRTATADIHVDARGASALILTAPGQDEVVSYYDSRLSPPLTAKVSLHPLPQGDRQETIAEIGRILSENSRIYALFWGEDERDPERVVENELAAHGHFLEARWYRGLRLARYANPIGETTLFRARRADFNHPENGETLSLLGYTLPERADWQAGDWLSLELRWFAQGQYSTRYRIFAQLLYPDGRLAITQDSEPGGNLRLTTGWTVGATIEDRRALAIPEDLSPGEYHLILGVYPVDNPGNRLRVGDDDHILLETIHIRAEKLVEE